MGAITLKREEGLSVTAVPNLFIERFMPNANGDYVKVYLYLLRLFSSESAPFSLSLLADRLENTEKDIVRALHYWDKHHVLSLKKDSSGEITSVTLLDLYQASPQTSAVSETACASEEKPASKRASYTKEEMERLTESEEMKWLLNIIEIYLERLLKPADVELILYLHETLGFSTELIMHLYDYCVSRNKKSLSYIEAVALSWASQGIDSVDKAEEAMEQYNEAWLTVKKAFGISRSAGAAERGYIEKWRTTYGFSNEMITEACNRSLLHTGKPDFKYADRILENWNKKGVRKLSEIERLDEEHNRRSAAQKAAQAQAVSPPKPAQNRFNAFPQRNYSASQYSALEQKLLQK